MTLTLTTILFIHAIPLVALALLNLAIPRPSGPCLHHDFDEQGFCIFCDSPED